MAASRPSLAGRAFLALLLTIGFYTLALSVIVGLLLLPWLEWQHLHRVHVKLALGCGITALIIAWSILPRIDRFRAPGPLLTEAEHPRLFELIQDVARETQQEMPREVYLVPDVNAFVAQRGGVLGLGSRRVMGLGLPLLAALSTLELKAVLAHEFGHYHGGDTKLGPWIYRTRAAIVRTVTGLGQGSIVRALFTGYAKLFLRLTNAVSRRQEYVADELAARVVGGQAFTSALRKIAAAAPAFDSYWREEAAPVLGQGIRPPLGEGFRLFLAAKPIVEATQRLVDAQMEKEQTHPYNTHPALRERLAAVAAAPPGPAPNGEPAIALLDNLPQQEHRLLESQFGPQTNELRPEAWTNVPVAAYVPQWQHTADKLRPALAGRKLADVPALLAGDSGFDRVTQEQAGKAESDDQARMRTQQLAATAVAAALHRAGWVPSFGPGEPVTLTQGGRTLRSFEMVARLAAGELTAEQWRQQCDAAGIAELPLAPPEVSSRLKAD